MNIEEIRAYALCKYGVAEDLKWGKHLCLTVCNKIFLVLGLDEHPVPASFKVEEEDFDNLIAIEGLSQAPYFAKRQWIRVDDISRIPEADWGKHIDISYRLVASKLTKKLQREIGLID